jgi:hypothetical protein
MLLKKIKFVFQKILGLTSENINTEKNELSDSGQSTSYIFISKERGLQIQEGFQKHIENFSNKKLIAVYNEIFRMKGIPNLGNLQGLYIMIMHDEFIKRFEKSPFIKKDDLNYSLGKYIFYFEATKNYIEIELN